MQLAWAHEKLTIPKLFMADEQSEMNFVKASLSGERSEKGKSSFNKTEICLMMRKCNLIDLIDLFDLIDLIEK